jgi:hypothetical protein
MPLLNDVKTLLNRLAPLGWRDLLLQHGLDITATDLEKELTRSLPTILRNLQGFATFTTSGIRAIEPGSPARSLLYHAFASADVHPTADGRPSDNPSVYPTLAEIDTLENYIYSVARRTINSFANPIIVVVAYQYRPTPRTTHQRHADLAFSRVGVARVGTEPYRYVAASRSFTPLPQNSDRGFAVLPARYAAFIAEYRSPSTTDAILRSVALDNSFIFTFPVHKLFPGKECLWEEDGTPINIDTFQFVDYHINEKLRRIHTRALDNPGFVPPLPLFNLNAPPFKRDSRDSQDLVRLETQGASLLVVPHDSPDLVRTATQRVGTKDEIARFRVPAQNDNNRFWTSLQISATQNGRSAPEYANIRHQVVPGPGQPTLLDLKTISNAQFQALLQNGNYEAAHLIDDTCDGAIGIQLQGLPLPVLPAYSLVTAVDFFPNVDQIEIERWVERISRRPIGFSNANIHFQQGGPKPLSDGRFTVSGQLSRSQRIPNPTLPDPSQPGGSNQKAFLRSEAANLTATAIVSSAASGTAFNLRFQTTFTVSWLPDTAADVFMPGWDISEHSDPSGPFYAAYGLGSPFPEDSKLCAALNSFWPAAAPDTARTFAVLFSPTAFPLMDRELGYHPQHLRVVAGEVQSQNGCDGEFGPFFETVQGGTVVNFADHDRSDYVTNALKGLMGFSGLERATATEMIARMEALRFCISVLPPNTDTVPNTRLWLVSAEKVDNWNQWQSRIYPRANTILTGAGYIYSFVDVTSPNSNGTAVGDPTVRRRHQIANRYDCQIDQRNLFFSVNGAAFRQRSRP